MLSAQAAAPWPRTRPGPSVLRQVTMSIDRRGSGPPLGGVQLGHLSSCHLARRGCVLPAPLHDAHCGHCHPLPSSPLCCLPACSLYEEPPLTLSSPAHRFADVEAMLSGDEVQEAIVSARHAA
jgi:hypothetical protein